MLIGPGCFLICTNHSIDAGERLQGVFNNQPITIGDRAVIRAGSVVTKDIPPDVIAAGNPCKALRPISEADRLMNRRDWGLGGIPA